MEEKGNCIVFETEEGESVSFLVLEETMLNGTSYLLVTEDVEEDGEEAEAYIMRRIEEKENQAVYRYEIVEDDVELEAVSQVFAELLEDIELEI